MPKTTHYQIPLRTNDQPREPITFNEAMRVIDDALNNIASGTGLADGAVATAKIRDQSVTYSKLQNLSASLLLLGRKSAGAGSVEEVSIEDFMSLFVKAGSIIMWPTSTPPPGWLECNGSALSRAVYAKLFAAINTTWGNGDGSTTFNIPDFRGVFPRGYDNGRGLDSGRAFASYQDDDYKSHAHNVYDPGHNHSFASPVGTTGSYGYRDGTNASSSGVPTVTKSTTGISVYANGGSETRGKNIALLFCIKY